LQETFTFRLLLTAEAAVVLCACRKVNAGRRRPEIAQASVLFKMAHGEGAKLREHSAAADLTIASVNDVPIITLAAFRTPDDVGNAP
jgi:hypothetical protein